MKKQSDGQTALHVSFGYDEASMKVVSKLIEVGDIELVMEKCSVNSTALHTACAKKSSVDFISKLVKIGGRDLVMVKCSKNGHTALHTACANKASIEVVLKLIEVGARDLLMKKRFDGYTA